MKITNMTNVEVADDIDRSKLLSKETQYRVATMGARRALGVECKTCRGTGHSRTMGWCVACQGWGWTPKP